LLAGLGEEVGVGRLGGNMWWPESVMWEDGHKYIIVN
jgi:hypothetical protein